MESPIIFIIFKNGLDNWTSYTISKIHNVEFPSTFSFMDAISIQGKTNFFEKRPTEYQKTSIGAINLVDDF